MRGEYDMAGTFNGNPPTMAASRAALTEVLTTDAYRTFDAIDAAMKEGLQAVIDEHHLPAYVTGAGRRGRRSTRRRRRASNVTRSVDERITYLAWLFHQNRGSSSRRGRSRRPDALGVAHGRGRPRYVENFAAFASAITRCTPPPARPMLRPSERGWG